ncbi:hypothetical protein JH06_1321 [Blastocystis sp. subtype 4]|uniref:hypothetical protein n=1 Tax=Blastocystis sp. subtype 4 TaxID=944170 RepID=UPI000711E294|nr:hypothetical protein JH06_1321 [Blastocystis sp. subtype 4]KNB45050.1 hypothetical protein JH06_1321 [Blastocystis sp. subtype 4]|eukprot:XP_014528492.1 hypothetical protein JH06_1321 [Blastocystis sp. subtype 4]
MNKFIVIATIFSVVLCSNCGVYSNPCETLPTLSWSTITKYTVSCGLDGYVSKIEKSVKNYPNDYCGSDSFMNNDYSYSLSKADGSTDKNSADYNTVLKKATFKVSDMTPLTRYHITCNPSITTGKKYSFKDVKCTILGINPWEKYTLIDQNQKGTVVFAENKMTFSLDLNIAYTKQSSFWGCWQWWSITLLVLVIIIVIVVIVLLIVKKKKPSMKKKGKK